MVGLHIRFKNRHRGSFAGSKLGNFFEWVTATWLRFTCMWLSSFIVIMVLISTLPPAEKIMSIIVAPLISAICWYVFLFLLLICKYLGTFGKFLAHGLVVYFFLFSRFIVQAPPIVDLSLTRNVRN